MPPWRPSKLLVAKVLLLIVPAFGVNCNPKARVPRFMPVLQLMMLLPLINGLRAPLGATL